MIDWLKRMDNELGTTLVPFVVGVHVGIAFTILVFVVAYVVGYLCSRAGN